MELGCAHCRLPIDTARAVIVSGTLLHAHNCLDLANGANPGLAPQATPDVSRETLHALTQGRLDALADVRALLARTRRGLAGRIVTPDTLMGELQAHLDDMTDDVEAP